VDRFTVAVVGTAVQYLAWQFDLEWLRRPLPVFPAIFPWTIALFFATSLTLVLLALAVRANSLRYQAIGKALGLLIGSIALGFLLEYGLRNPVSTSISGSSRSCFIKQAGLSPEDRHYRPA
jgi:hypothetical protein